MGEEIHFQVRAELLRALDESGKASLVSLRRAEEVIVEAAHFQGALDPNGEPIIPESRVEYSRKTVAHEEKIISQLETFRADLLLISSAELRSKLMASDELRFSLLYGLQRFFSFSKVNEQFIKEQQWKAERYGLNYVTDKDFFREKAFRLLLSADQPQQPTETAADQQPKQDGRLIVKDQEAYERDMFPQMIELLSKGATKSSATEVVAAPYGIAANTVEVRYNKIMKSRKEAENLLKKYGNSHLIEKLDQMKG